MEMRHKIIFISLVIALLVVSTTAFLLWQKFEPEVYYYVPPEKSFIYSQGELKYGIEKYLREAVETQMLKLIEEKKSFIYVDLKEMKLTLYKEGKSSEVFPVQSKGEEWFWGETPPGVYSAGFKARLHFSSAARVWMPYAVQYYGNYFIHGWPYDRAGRQLPPGPSGGCVRLRTQDAAVVFEFAKSGTPILVFDEKATSPLPALLSLGKEAPPIDINGQSFLVADLDTGEILLSKDVDSEIEGGFAVGGMLALAASDSVNLEKRITARSWMMEGVKEGIIVPERSYRGYDLLEPLLSRSSKEAALVLSRFLTAEKFVALMNDKANGIGMKNTFFADVTGTLAENKTTLYDVARLMRYIRDYRSFILDISQEWLGEREDEKQTIFKALEMKTSNDIVRFIFIGIADSTDAKADVENMLSWLNNNFGLK